MFPILRPKVLQIGVTVLAVMALSSCITSKYYAEYPAEWGPLLAARGDECPDLVGTYLNEAEEADDNPPRDSYDPVSLSTLLFPSLEHFNVSVVTINQPDKNSIEIVLEDGTTVLFRRTLSRDSGDFFCGPKHVLMTGTSRPPTEGGTLVEKVRANLAKTEDGSLVIYLVVVDRGVGLLVIPYSSSSSYWYRFKRQGA